MEFAEQLRTIKLVLKHSDLTDEERADLEHCHAEMTCPLLKAGATAFRRGSDEVGMALAMAHVYKFARPNKQKNCVIYCRVSTESQTKGMGLWRQLDTCQRYARERDMSVLAVFSEVMSGIEPLPARAQAQRMAVANNCPLLCEDYSRWSRAGASDVPPAYVVMTSESERLLDEELRKLFTPIQLRILSGGAA